MTSLALVRPVADPLLQSFVRPAAVQIIAPRGVALCGYPGAGKTTVAEILEELYGVRPVDDGHVLREFAVEKLGLGWDDVRTQAGKARTTEILGRTWQNREILGEFGKLLEGMFGEHILPFIATRGLQPGRIYSFPSCRKGQGHFYRSWGGICVEVIKSGTGPKFDFDHYDAAAAQFVINNHTLDRDTLVAEVRRVFDPILSPVPAPEARFDVV